MIKDISVTLARIEALRREKTDSRVHSLVMPDGIDYAGAGLLVQHAMSALDEGIPNRQRRRVQAALLALIRGANELLQWAYYNGYFEPAAMSADNDEPFAPPKAAAAVEAIAEGTEDLAEGNTSIWPKFLFTSVEWSLAFGKALKEEGISSIGGAESGPSHSGLPYLVRVHPRHMARAKEVFERLYKEWNAPQPTA